MSIGVLPDVQLAEATVSTKRALKIAGVSFRQIDYWDRLGFFEPHTPARGSGTRRRFSASDLRVISAIKATMACAGTDVNTNNDALVTAVARYARNLNKTGVVIVDKTAMSFETTDMADIIALARASVSGSVSVVVFEDIWVYETQMALK